MSVELYGSDRWKARSTDTKPTGIETGDSYYEQDTGRVYQAVDDDKIRMIQHDVKLEKGIEDTAVSSLINLYGDTFAKLNPDHIWTLDGDYNDSVSDDDLEKYNTGGEFRYAGLKPFVGYKSFYTEGHAYLQKDFDNLVGSNSFLIGGWFHLYSSGSVRAEGVLFHLGAGVSNTTPEVAVRYDHDYNLVFRVRSATSTIEKKIPAWNLFCDSGWHYIGILFERESTKYTMTPIITHGVHELLAWEPVETTGTFGQPGALNQSFAIGTEYKLGGYSNLTELEVMNFQVYNFSGTIESKNVLKLVLAGIREKPYTDITITQVPDFAYPLNNKVTINSPPGNYTQTIVNLEEGLYDISIIHSTDVNKGKIKFKIDGVNYGDIDGHNAYASSEFTTEQSILNNVSLDKGPHFVKLEVATRNYVSNSNEFNYSIIQFIKRSGPTQGGSSEMLLFGPEMFHGDNNYKHTQGVSYYRNAFGNVATTSYDGSYIEDIFYMHGGLYQCSMGFRLGPDFGFLKIYINNKLVKNQQCYNATINESGRLEFQARFEQGKNLIKFKIDGKHASSTYYHFQMTFFRATLMSSNANIQFTSVMGGDTDGRSTDGHNSADDIVLDQGVRFGQVQGPTVNQDGNHVKFLRYFSGGLYQLNYLHTKLNTYGNVAINLVDKVGTKTHVTDVNQNTAVQGRNNTAYKLLKINRGFYYIEVEEDHVSTDRRTFAFNEIRFEKIMSMDNTRTDTHEEQDQDGFVKLGQARSDVESSDVVLDVARYHPEEYDEFEMIIEGKMGSVGTYLLMRINDQAGDDDYYTIGERIHSYNDGGTRQYIADNGGRHIYITGNQVLPTGQLFTTKIFFNFVREGSEWRLIGTGHTNTHNRDHIYFSFGTKFDTQRIARINIFSYDTSSTIEKDNIIVLRGRRNKQ